LFKRIVGVLLLLGGLALTVLTAVMLAYDIPRNFTVTGEGLDAVIELIEKYELKHHILLICLGLTVTLSSSVMLLSPRRVRVAAPAAPAAEAETVTAETDGADDTAAEAPVASPRLVGTFYTQLLGTGFANPGGRDRQRILSELRGGDVAVCRTVVKAAPGETETVGVFTVRGEQMGTIDLAVLRAVRDRYPDHRIGVTIERVSGGRGVPYTCGVRVGVYRS
jgi:ABC-type amino acid transport substrate-binding protein